jgi:hypothetical protein
MRVSVGTKVVSISVCLDAKPDLESLSPPWMLLSASFLVRCFGCFVDDLVSKKVTRYESGPPICPPMPRYVSSTMHKAGWIGLSCLEVGKIV